MRSRFALFLLILSLAFPAACTAQQPGNKLPACDSTKFDCACKPPKPINRSVKPKNPPTPIPAVSETKAPESANQQPLGPWVNALVQIQATNQQLLLLQQRNYADELKLQRDRLENVEEPTQGTNQFRAQTERELADSKEDNDNDLTQAKISNDKLITGATVGLMKAEGPGHAGQRMGNLIGAARKPAYLLSRKDANQYQHDDEPGQCERRQSDQRSRIRQFEQRKQLRRWRRRQQ